MSVAERAFQLLLRAYPTGFRAEFGREMALLFRDQHRESNGRVVSFWAATLWDIARSAPQLRLEALRVKLGSDNQTEETNMKPMAILAVVIGALEAVNAMAEAWAGGVANRGASSLVGLTMAVIAGVLLTAAGVQLLRRSPGSATLARVAALLCLAVFALVAIATPMFSVLATLLGIGFPILLLLFLWGRGRGQSVPTTA